MQLTSLIESLNQLPCFSEISHVTSLDSGFSQPCYKVFTSEKNYFVKSSPFSSSLPILLNKLAAKHGLSPAIIYQDDHWLVTDFIEAKHIEGEHIHCAVNLMVKCHQLPITTELQISHTSVDKLNCLNLCHSLIEQNNFPEEKVSKLKQFALLSHNHLQNVLLEIEKHHAHKQLVGCHGDINFSNVFISSDNTPWLIDFECACLAPAEFDMAMFIAINTLTEQESSDAIKAYQTANNTPLNCLLSNTLIQAYLPLCYLINALWYDHASWQHPDSEILKTKAKQQWQHIGFS